MVAGAAGNVYVHPPGPKDLTTLRGHLYNVSTEPDFRRRGLARACVVALLDWFRDETAVGQVELHATDGRRSTSTARSASPSALPDAADPPQLSPRQRAWKPCVPPVGGEGFVGTEASREVRTRSDRGAV